MKKLFTLGIFFMFFFFFAQHASAACNPPPPPPPPASVCGNGTCESGEFCSSCPGDCGDCGSVACGGASYASCGGGQYCCGGDVCVNYSDGSLAGCCPGSAPYFDGAGCYSSPPVATNTPKPATPTPTGGGGGGGTPTPTTGVGPTAPPPTLVPDPCGVGRFACGPFCCDDGQSCDGPPGFTCTGGPVGVCNFPPYTQCTSSTTSTGDACGSGTWEMGSEVCTLDVDPIFGNIPGACGFCNLPPTSTPTPVTYSISGKVFEDLNGNRQQDCSGSCNNGVGDERNISGATIWLSIPGYGTYTSTTNSSGNYSLTGLPAGTYTPTYGNPPAGYTISLTADSSTIPPNTTNRNYAIAPSVSCTALASYTVFGAVFSDTVNNNCSSGATPKENARTEFIDGGSNIVTVDTTDSSGVYTMTDYTPTDCDGYHVTAGGETIKRVRVDGGPWQSTGFSGSDYGPFTFPSPTKNVDFCISEVSSWFQVTTGDVRFKNLVNKIPSASSKVTATDATFPGILYSSNSTPDLNGKNASALNWKVGSEYTWNKNFSNGKGTLAYDFYISKAKQLGIAITEIPSFSAADLATMPSGVYLINGTTTISGSTITFPTSPEAGKHIVLLVNGSAIINTEIKVPSGNDNLFVLASKNSIGIQPDVGNTTFSSSQTNLDGYYSAQDSITLISKKNCGGSPVVRDERLLVGGALVANALNPFTDNGSGRIINNRSLCNSDATYSSLLISTRPDFITQLTDFYKTTYKAFREVEP